MPFKVKQISNLRRDERSVASIELALILPILLIVLFAIVELSTLLYDKAVITNASREAARAGIVNNSVTDDELQGYVRNYCGNRLITFGSPNNPVVLISRPTGTDPGNPLIVTVNYQFTGLVLGTMIRPQNWDQTLSATSIMNFE
jgi:Flp pilus assembly protein TadG